MMGRIIIAVIALMAVSIQASPEFTRIQHSYANVDDFVIDRTHFEIVIDFDRHVIRGTATLHLHRMPGSTADEVVLDSAGLTVFSMGKDALSYEKRIVPTSTEKGLGEPLVIRVPQKDQLEIVVHYETSDQAGNLIWQTPEQTGSGYPSLHMLNEPTGYRSFAPGQDRPDIRQSFSANIAIQANEFYQARAGTDPLIALISGTRNVHTANREMVYKDLYTKQDAPIPTYLFVIAVGRFIHRDVSANIGYFSDNEKILDAAMQGQHHVLQRYYDALTHLYGGQDPWGYHDLMILGPHFAYGGMENPGLIYVHPSAVVGEDVSVVCHELAHNWTGNTVTNAKWEGFFLNEGWTAFTEYEVVNRVHATKGERWGDANYVFSYTNNLVNVYDPAGILSNDPMKRNKTQLGKQGVSEVPPELLLDFSVYSKGAAMLRSIKSIVGEMAFWEYARAYIAHFRFKPITAEDFIAFSVTYLAEHPQPSERTTWQDFFNAWIFSPGITPALEPSLAHLGAATSGEFDHYFPQMKASKGRLDFSTWSAVGINFMMRGLEAETAYKKELVCALESNPSFLAKVDALPEVKAKWMLLLVKVGAWKQHQEAIRAYLKENGRLKFVRPIYGELVKTGAEGRLFAQSVFQKSAPCYFSHVRHAVQELFT